MLEIMQSVCRKCEKVYPLVAGVACPECHGQLVTVRFVEVTQQTVQGNKCPCCYGKGKVEDNFEVIECWVCEGTGIRR